MNKISLIALWLTASASVVFVPPSAVAQTPWVTTSAPHRVTAVDFKQGSLAVTVTCRKACSATVFATIKASVAKRLGFAGVQGRYVLVGTGTKVLKAQTPTKIRVVPTSAAKKHLAPSVDVIGSAKGVPTLGATVNNYFAGWYTRLG